MIKIFSLFCFTFAFTFVNAIQPYEPNYQVKGDSIYFENGNSVSINDYLKDHPDELSYIEQKKLNKTYEDHHKNENNNSPKTDTKSKEADNSKEEYKFDKSWKFYFVIIIFPVFLILFLLLYLKSRKKV